jgi:hypothetical protein
MTGSAIAVVASFASPGRNPVGSAGVTSDPSDATPRERRCPQLPSVRDAGCKRHPAATHGKPHRTGLVACHADSTDVAPVSWWPQGSISLFRQRCRGEMRTVPVTLTKAGSRAFMACGGKRRRDTSCLSMTRFPGRRQYRVQALVSSRLGPQRRRDETPRCLLRPHDTVSWTLH